MYVILTSKPGQFRTEIVDGLRPLEAYDYLFYGQTRRISSSPNCCEERTKIRVIEDDHRDRQRRAFQIPGKIRDH